MTHDELRALCKAATEEHECSNCCAHVQMRTPLSPDVVLGLLDEIARLAPSPSREACCWPCFKDLNQSDGVADLYAEREDEYVAACGICGHDMEG